MSELIWFGLEKKKERERKKASVLTSKERPPYWSRWSS